MEQNYVTITLCITRLIYMTAYPYSTAYIQNWSVVLAGQIQKKFTLLVMTIKYWGGIS